MKKRTKAQIHADKHRTGRPKLPRNRARTQSVRVRLTRTELSLLKKRAGATALSVAAYIRNRILED